MVNNDTVNNVLICHRRFSALYVKRVYTVCYVFEWNFESRQTTLVFVPSVLSYSKKRKLPTSTHGILPEKCADVYPNVTFAISFKPN